jgi:hypothetical protein
MGFRPLQALYGAAGQGFVEPDGDRNRPSESSFCAIRMRKAERRRDAAATRNAWYPLIALLFCVGVFALAYEFGEMISSPPTGAIKAAMFGATLGAALWAMGVLKQRRK